MSRAGLGGAQPAFEALDRAGTRWCLWRGTPRLEHALSGGSDFDLLVDPNDLALLADALSEVGYKRARTSPSRTAEGLEDWLGLAGPSGPLLHLHVHARMLVGEPRLYRFRLPFEAEVLERRRRLLPAPGLGAPFAADPTDEAALLLIRAALQVRARDRLPAGRTLGRLLAKVEHDLTALLAGTEPAAVRARIEAWLGPGAADGLQPPFIEAAELGRLRARARRELAAHTSQSDAAAVASGLGRGLEAAARRLARRGHGPLPRASRCGPRGGASIGLVGPGAEAAAEGLFALFGSKLDTLRVKGSGTAETRRARARSVCARGWLALWADEPGGARELGLARELGTDECLIELAGETPQPSPRVVAAVWERI